MNSLLKFYMNYLIYFVSLICKVIYFTFIFCFYAVLFNLFLEQIVLIFFIFFLMTYSLSYFTKSDPLQVVYYIALFLSALFFVFLFFFLLYFIFSFTSNIYSPLSNLNFNTLLFPFASKMFFCDSCTKEEIIPVNELDSDSDSLTHFGSSVVSPSFNTNNYSNTSPTVNNGFSIWGKVYGWYDSFANWVGWRVTINESDVNEELSRVIDSDSPIIPFEAQRGLQTHIKLNSVQGTSLYGSMSANRLAKNHIINIYEGEISVSLEGLISKILSTWGGLIRSPNSIVPFSYFTDFYGDLIRRTVVKVSEQPHVINMDSFNYVEFSAENSIYRHLQLIYFFKHSLSEIMSNHNYSISDSNISYPWILKSQFDIPTVSHKYIDGVFYFNDSGEQFDCLHTIYSSELLTVDQKLIADFLMQRLFEEDLVFLLTEDQYFNITDFFSDLVDVLDREFLNKDVFKKDTYLNDVLNYLKENYILQ